MNSIASQCLDITKVIIELINSSGGSDFVQKVPRGEKRIVFYKIDRKILPNYHTRPLHITTSIHNVELKHALIDIGSSSNIIPLLILEVTRIPRA